MFNRSTTFLNFLQFRFYFKRWYAICRH